MNKSSKNRIELNTETEKEAVERACDFLRRGYSVVFPTDTIYALGVNALDEDAVKYFFSLKKRASSKPISIFVKDIESIKRLAEVTEPQEEVLNKFLPGKFTFVLNQRQDVKLSGSLSAYTGKIGFRITESRFVQYLVEEFEHPITASSANISGEEPKRNIDEIIEQFDKQNRKPDFFVDSGSITNSDPSTVIDITGKQPKIVRMSATDPVTMKKIMSMLDN